MTQTKLLMGMPVTLEIVDDKASGKTFNKIFNYFDYVDHKFSTYKKTSEISQINTGKLNPKKYSRDMKTIFEMAGEAKKQTNGYFDILHHSKYDPSGIVKGWAIINAAKLLQHMGFKNFCVEAGGDIQTSGLNLHDASWRVGIRDPFNEKQIVKVVYVSGAGVATSGTYIRGQHIYYPKTGAPIVDIVSLTVIGPDICQADKFATAAFAMGKKGIEFIEKLNGFEGYMIDENGVATYTSKFNNYTKSDETYR